MAAWRALTGHCSLPAGAMMRPADPSAQLVELREAETIGPVDDDRICRGHINSGFDDSRAQKDIEAPVVEVEHDLFQFALRHLAVSDPDIRLGHQLANPFLDVDDVFDPVMNEVHLSAALDFA